MVEVLQVMAREGLAIWMAYWSAHWDGESCWTDWEGQVVALDTLTMVTWMKMLDEEHCC